MADTYSVITRHRRKALCQITSGAITTLPKVAYIALGKGGVDEEGEPIIPLETQTRLREELQRYPIEPVEYPVETTARYSVVVPKNDLVGEKISEAALVDEEGNLCAIRNMYIKQKDAGTTFTFVFDDEY